MKPRHRRSLELCCPYCWRLWRWDGLRRLWTDSYVANGWIECYNDYFQRVSARFCAASARAGTACIRTDLRRQCSAVWLERSLQRPDRRYHGSVYSSDPGRDAGGYRTVGSASSDGRAVPTASDVFSKWLRPEVTGRSVLWLAGLSAAACILTVCVWPLIGRGREAMNGAASYVVERLNSWNRSMVDQGLVLSTERRFL